VLVSSYDPQLAQHAQAIPDHPHLAPGLIHPTDGDLGNAIASSLGDKEQLDIEAVAVDLKHREEISGNLGLKKLKTTLGVGHASHTQAPYHRMKDAAEHLSVPLRSESARRIPQSPGAYDYIRLCYDLPLQLLYLLDGCCPISIGKQP